MAEVDRDVQDSQQYGAQGNDNAGADDYGVAEAEFDDVKDRPGGSALSLQVVMDISMPVTVELGRTELTVQELLRLRNGSVVELDKMAGEPVEIYIREVCFARGEVVVVDNDFGVRVTEILNPSRPLEGISGGDKEG